MVALNIGCGPLRLPGEIGVDREATSAADVRADLLAIPFRDGSVDTCRLDHVLEHLPYRLAPTALLEARRVLKPGGTLRVGIPDLLEICAAYAARPSLADRALLVRWLYGSQAHPGEHHQSGWDASTLTDLLVGVGFTSVTVRPDPERPEGICLASEAQKP